MKKMMIVALTLSAMLIWCNPVSAVPYLQLDISDGVYVGGGEETIFATTDPFTLYALIDPNAQNKYPDPYYYISIALLKEGSGLAESESGDFGYIEVDGDVINVTDDMIFGTPPLEDVLQQNDLPSHGIYETYFTEVEFEIDETKKSNEYDSMEDPGGLENWDGGDFLYYEDFSVKLSGLSDGYSVHFDLYTKGYNNRDQLEIQEFAPFSHDAAGTPGAPIPEPATVFLMGFGLVGLAAFGRRRMKK